MKRLLLFTLLAWPESEVNLDTLYYLKGMLWLSIKKP